MSRRTRTTARRGSTYLLVLGSTMLVTVIGLSAVFAVTLERRRAEAAGDAVKARLYAQSALEMAAYWMENDPEWRSNRPNGAWATDQPIGEGTYSVQVVDPADGSLSNSKTGSVYVTCTGRKGAARHMFRVTMEADVPESAPALEALATAIHCGQNIVVNLLVTLSAVGAPASTNATLVKHGTIVGDVEAASVSGLGLIVGSVTVPAPAKDLPAPDVFDAYVARATQLPYSPQMRGVVLTPTLNTYGGSLNADGVYYIDAGGGDLTIEGSRIQGTLVVNAPGRRVIIKDAALLERHRADYPVLIVKGWIELNFTASAIGLSETLWNVNFNPVGADRLGFSNTTKLDIFPSKISGLVHCMGSLNVFNQPAEVDGAILCEGAAAVESGLTINHDPTLVSDPPMGYTQDPADLATMKIARGSWRQIVQ
jgi:hypothetical protein